MDCPECAEAARAWMGSESAGPIDPDHVKFRMSDTMYSDDSILERDSSATVAGTARIGRRKLRTLRCEHFEHLWHKYRKEESPQILRALSISHDGGLDVDSLLKLWATREEKLKRVWCALIMVFFTLGNVCYIVALDLEVLLGYSNAGVEDKFLLGKEVWTAIAEGILQRNLPLNGEKTVVFAELTLLLILMGRLCVLVYRVFYARKECFRWYCLAQLYWQWLPFVSTFSSMKLLHWVSPRVLLTEVFLEASFTAERLANRHYLRAAWKLAWFVMYRAFCLLIGFDAFLVKLRLTSRFVDLKEFHMRYCILGVFFMFQVLGIVNLAIFARKRLFVFIFGGEDGVVQTREKATEMFWNAMLAKRLHEVFPRLPFLTIMLSLDDYDFQTLTLREVHRNTLATVY